MEVNEKCRKLRKQTLPPSWANHDEEAIKRWRNV